MENPSTATRSLAGSRGALGLWCRRRLRRVFSLLILIRPRRRRACRCSGSTCCGFRTADKPGPVGENGLARAPGSCKQINQGELAEPTRLLLYREKLAQQRRCIMWLRIAKNL